MTIIKQNLAVPQYVMMIMCLSEFASTKTVVWISLSRSLHYGFCQNLA